MTQGLVREGWPIGSSGYSLSFISPINVADLDGDGDLEMLAISEPYKKLYIFDKKWKSSV